MAAQYLTTDLFLKARFDLHPLVERLEADGLFCLGEPRERGGVWSTVLELGLTRGRRNREGREIGSMLLAIEGLEGEARLAWDRCLLREFDVGFECGGEGFCATTLLKPQLVQRIAAAGVAVRITIYRDSSPRRR